MNALTVTIGGKAFANIVAARIDRDLERLAGTFDLTIVDDARLLNVGDIAVMNVQSNAAVMVGDAVSIAIDGETVLTGWIDRVQIDWGGEHVLFRIQGRDKTGDLVDCTPAPSLPVEFHGVDLLRVATQVCQPFGIAVTADVPVGAPFTRLSRYKHWRALQFLESAARQRAVLLTSDGIGGLLLTRGGSSKAPADLVVGQNVRHTDATFDWTRRYSDYFVIQDSCPLYDSAPALSAGSAPSSSEPGDGPDAAPSGTGALGHATDPKVTRYRPTVRLTRSQSGMSTLQEQAEWAARVARGKATRLHLDVLGFRAGTAQALWRPNQLATVWDPVAELDAQLLIAGVQFQKDDRNEALTRLRVVGRDAYDRIDEAARPRHRRRHGRHGRDEAQNLITTVPSS